MTINNIDRDMRWIKSGFEGGLSDSIPLIQPPPLRSNGVVYDKICRFGRNSARSVNMIASGQRAAGSYLIGPDETGGCAYRVKGQFCVSQSGIIVYLVAGIAQAETNANGSGQSLEKCIVIGCSNTGNLHVDDLFYLDPFGTISNRDYSQRAVGFAVITANPESSVQSMAHGMFSVQRLSVSPPEICSAIR